MSAVKQIQAVARDRAGKGAARAVRRQGQVPAVIYGGGEAAEAIALDFNQTKQLIFAGRFLTTVFEIDVDGTQDPRDPARLPARPGEGLPDPRRLPAPRRGADDQGRRAGARRRPGPVARRQARRHAPDRRAHGRAPGPVGRDPGLSSRPRWPSSTSARRSTSAIALPQGAKPTVSPANFTLVTVRAAVRHARGGRRRQPSRGGRGSAADGSGEGAEPVPT